VKPDLIILKAELCVGLGTDYTLIAAVTLEPLGFGKEQSRSRTASVRLPNLDSRRRTLRVAGYAEQKGQK
jgi:hypothetical protein